MVQELESAQKATFLPSSLAQTVTPPPLWEPPTSWAPARRPVRTLFHLRCLGL